MLDPVLMGGLIQTYLGITNCTMAESCDGIGLYLKLFLFLHAYNVAHSVENVKAKSPPKRGDKRATDFGDL